MLNAWRIVYLIWTVSFTSMALLAIAQFHRKRKSFYLRGRALQMAMLQLFCVVITWVDLSIRVLIPTWTFTTPCGGGFYLQSYVGSAVVSIAALRVWLIFRQVHVCQAQQQLLEKASNRERTKTRSATINWFLKHPIFLDKRFIYRFIGVVFFSRILALIVEHALLLQCTGEPSFQEIYLRFWMGIILIVLGTCSKTVYMFVDNFGICSEFKRLFLVLLAAALNDLLFSMVLRSRLGDETTELVRNVSINFAAQAVFTTSAIIPLLAQRRLDHRVASGVYDAASFERCLRDPVALEAFRTFLVNEFAIENLEFYEHASEFKREYDGRRSNERWKVANMLLNTFIADDAPAEINIDHGMRRELVSLLDPAKNEEVEKYVFDDATKECLHVMKMDPFTRFVAAKGETSALPTYT